MTAISTPSATILVSASSSVNSASKQHRFSTMTSLPQGDGPLFSDPSANNAREIFAQKPRAHVDKLMAVSEAVARFVHDGDYLAIGGFGGDRLPTAVCHE